MNLRKSSIPSLSDSAGGPSSAGAAPSGLGLDNPEETVPAAPTGSSSPSGEGDTHLGLAPIRNSATSPQPVAAGEVTGADLAVSFRPTEAQSRVKARFWSRWDAASPHTPTLAAAKQLTQSAALESWWSKPGFKDWFLSTSVTQERVEHLLHLALSAAEDVLLSTDPKSQGARVAMVKTVAEMGGLLRRAAPVGLDAKTSKQLAAVESMGRDELLKLLQEHGLRVEQVVQVSPTHSPLKGN